MPRTHAARLIAAALLLALPAAARAADLAISSNDNHSVLQDGRVVTAPNAPPDTVSFIALGAHPRVVASIDAPGSVIGPPMAVAIAPDHSFALIASATKASPQALTGAGDPGSPPGQSGAGDGAWSGSYTEAGLVHSEALVPDNQLSLIDLSANPPVIAQRLTAGLGAAAVAIAPDGKLALVANRVEGTISAFAIANHRLQPLPKLDLGNPNAMPSGVVFAHGGQIALVSRAGDDRVSVLHIVGQTVLLDPHSITTGVGPAAMAVNPAGTLAAVVNSGRDGGDVDSVSLIDLTPDPLGTTPMRAIDVMAVPDGAEGLAFSPDGKTLAVVAQNGTTNLPNTPFHHAHGRLLLFAVSATHGDQQMPQPLLRQIAEAPVGQWSQGVAFSRDGATIVVQNMVEKSLSVLHWSHGKLAAAAPLSLGAGPASIATPWP